MELDWRRIAWNFTVVFAALHFTWALGATIWMALYLPFLPLSHPRFSFFVFCLCILYPWLRLSMRGLEWYPYVPKPAANMRRPEIWCCLVLLGIFSLPVAALLLLPETLQIYVITAPDTFPAASAFAILFSPTWYLTFRWCFSVCCEFPTD